MDLHSSLRVFVPSCVTISSVFVVSVTARKFALTGVGRSIFSCTPEFKLRRNRIDQLKLRL